MFRRGGRAAQGVLFAALEERGRDAGAGDGVQLARDGAVRASGAGYGRDDIAGHQRVPGADGPGPGGECAHEFALR